LTTSFALDKGKPRESAGRKATGLNRFCRNAEAVWPPGYRTATITKEKTMITIRTGRAAACLTLTLASAFFGGLTATAHADVVQAPGMGKTATIAKPVVKLGDAMLQERETLPDGTVRTQTTLLPAKTHAAKAGAKSDSAQRPGKA
jgi:hypothetical protein